MSKCACSWALLRGFAAAAAVNTNEIRSFVRSILGFSFVIIIIFIFIFSCFSFVIWFQSIFICLRPLLLLKHRKWWVSEWVCVGLLSCISSFCLSYCLALPWTTNRNEVEQKNTTNRISFSLCQRSKEYISCFAQCFSEWLCLERKCAFHYE